LRRYLDRLYWAGGALAAVSLACIAAVMLLQAAMREAGLLFRGADDIVGWLCAASAFLALGTTFRHGELVRVGLVLDRLPPGARRLAETMALGTALAFVACLLWASARFVYQSWQFDEVAQGLVRIPIWIPQTSFVIGAAIFFVAVLDDFIVLARGGTPAYRRAEDTQRAQPGAPLPE
jgi:TRAP-type C4-dicarboxylate transport system permease small subunit